MTTTVEVPLGDGLIAMIDARDAELVAGLKWRPLEGHTGKVYAYTSVAKRMVYMHRLIAGTPPGYETDHRNGNGLDNRRANLRVATPSQNRANMGKPRRPDGAAHTSQYKGVSWDRSRGRWQSKIQANRVHRNLGRYDNERDAALAYDRAALAQWGEFASINFQDTAA